MSFADEKRRSVEEQLGAYGPWKVLEARSDPGSFGNECVVLANDELSVRFSLDRGVEHADLARFTEAQRLQWFPMEIVAVQAGLRSFEELGNHYRACADSLDEETGRFDTEPLFEDSVAVLVDEWDRLVPSVADSAPLFELQGEVERLVESILDGIGIHEDGVRLTYASAHQA